jgi:hypothetical protein
MSADIPPGRAVLGRRWRRWPVAVTVAVTSHDVLSTTWGLPSASCPVADVAMGWQDLQRDASAGK